MIKNIILALKGVLFGISNAIAGVSGGTIAVITGVYDKLINSINGIFKDWKNSLLFLIIYGVGALVGFFLGSKVISIALKYAAIPTSMLFAGLVLGGIPTLSKPLKGKYNLINILFSILGVAIVVGLLFIPENDALKSNLEFIDYVMLFICGFIAAVAMVTPGVSGMMMFMLFGYYTLFNATISSLFDFSVLKENMLICLPVGLGIVVGIFTAAKCIAFLLKRYTDKTNFVIFGFVIASVFCIIYKADWQMNALMIGLGVVAFIVGAVLSFSLEKLGAKMDNSQELVKE